MTTRFADLRARVLDLPEVVAIAREIVASMGVAERVSWLPGDFRKTAFPFDPEPTQDDPVDVRLSWRSGDQTVGIKAAELFLEGDKPVATQEWVYTGSAFLPDGRYKAAVSGSLISFVHDPESIIQHRQGIGLGQYGGVVVNRAVAPPVGTRVNVSIRRHNPR